MPRAVNDNSFGSDPYPFLPEFARAVVYYACTRAAFFGKFGEELRPDCFTDATATLALQAAKAFAKENPSRSTTTVAVLQQLRNWMDQGKTTFDQIKLVNAYFDAAEDEGIMPEAEVSALLVPILRDRLQATAVGIATQGVQHRSEHEIQKAFDTLARSKRLGVQAGDTHSRAGANSVEGLRLEERIDRLMLGILEVDNEINGLAQGCLGVVLAATNTGKSICLTQVAGAAAMQGANVAIATLEMPKNDVLARLLAGMSDVPFDRIRYSTRELPESDVKKISEAFSRPGLGALVTKYFTPSITTVGDIAEWLKEIELEYGMPFDVVMIDYDAKLSSGRRGGKEDSSYMSAGHIYEDLLELAQNPERKRWVWTAAQAKRGEQGKKRILTTDDFADSLQKGRHADLVISLNPVDAGLIWYIAKNRFGKANVQIGPLPTDFVVSRVAPMTFFGLGDPRKGAATAADVKEAARAAQAVKDLTGDDT